MCLFCENANISENITIIDVGCDDIKSLPDLSRFSELTILNCSGCCNLTKIGKLPNSLKEFYCDNTHLVDLPDLPPNLERFSCHDCYHIKCINSLPKTLKSLCCYECEILEFINDLPDSLEILDCSSSEIKQPPKLPESLLVLDCSFTKLKQLPILPKNLKRLYCSNCNNLEFLGKLPEGLEILNCEGSSILAFENLPKNLKRLYCSYTKLSSYPVLKNSGENFVACVGCEWLPDSWTYKENIKRLKTTQRFVKKFLYRRRARVFSSLKNSLPRDICGLITN